jgi:hypothetical protein
MTFRLSEVPTALSTQEKSTLFPRRDVYRILGIHCQLGMTKAQIFVGLYGPTKVVP